MTGIDQLTQILENENEDAIIPFLKPLNAEQKKELVPGLKKLYKYYSEFTQQNGSTSYTTRWTAPKRKILGISVFICFNQKDFEATGGGGSLSTEVLNNILPWYCPGWFSNYIDKHADQQFLPYYFNYDWYMCLVEGGYLQPNPLLIVRALPGILFENSNERYEHIYKPGNLLLREVTLKEHIWYIFDLDSQIHAFDNYMRFSDGSTDGRWIAAITDLANRGVLDRERLLMKAIAAVTNNFNQSLTNWFIDLFVSLAPTTAELLSLQYELMNTFNATSSKALNTSLKYLKELVGVPGFSVDAFLDNVPIAITSNYKNAVASVLMILDKLAKMYPDYAEQVCLLSCQSLINQDNTLQVKAAKLIQKHGTLSSAVLKDTVAAYYDNLYSESKNLLTGFVADITAEGPVAAMVDQPIEQKSIFNKIDTPQTFDEFVFLASQAFDQNKVYHFDLLPAALLRFQGEMTADNILKLVPAFQRAYKLITSDWRSTTGYLDDMLAIFFIDYGKLLVRLHPRAAEPVRQLHEVFEKLAAEKKAKWDGYKVRLGGIKGWDVFTHSLGYKPHKHILLNAWYMLERQMHLPLLSTPTHEPCGVSVMALIGRLAEYQKARTGPGDMDLQVAVARCIIEDKEAAINLAAEKLSGEYLELINFLLGKEYMVRDAYKLKVGWLVAALTRDAPVLNTNWFTFSDLNDAYLTSDFAWETVVQHFTYQNYDFKLKQNVDLSGTRKIIKINFGPKVKELPVLKGLIGKLLPGKNEIPPSLYNYLTLDFKYISAEQNDIKRLLYLNPSKPEILLAHIIDKCFRSPDMAEEINKKIIINTLEALLELDIKFGRMAHLLIASCLLSSDKTARIYASELWISAINGNRINSEQLGEIIGIHEQIELAPLKRFTDVVISNMFNISVKHNAGLENMLGACIKNMPAKPVPNTKKLLEIYAEILAINKNMAVDANIIKQLDKWAVTDSLAKISAKIKVAIN